MWRIELRSLINNTRDINELILWIKVKFKKILNKHSSFINTSPGKENLIFLLLYVAYPSFNS